MTFPYITSITGGFLLVLQIILAVTVSGARNQLDIAIGDGGQNTLLRAIRRHGNLAENAGLFVAGLTLLELSNALPTLQICLCAVFVLARLLHVVGMSQANATNTYRLLGGAGTYISGLVLGGALLWVGVQAAL
jgi:uncharacterized membrane protein YecN with MAPEG domain